MSLINVNAIEPSTGTDITLGASGDTITVPSGATFTQSGTMNASAITAGTVATARLGSGTADATTFLRGDQTYASAGGTNTPYFQASVTSDQSITHDTTTKCSFDRADVDSASGYDTTNKRYTIPSGQGGYWHIGYTVFLTINGEYIASGYVYPEKNGSNFPSFNSRQQGVQSRRADSYPLRGIGMTKSFIADCSASDYIEIFVNYGDSRGSGNTVNVGEYYSIFWGYRLVQ
jgi:hypothetical protein